MERLRGWVAEIAANACPVVAVSHKAAIRALLALATGWDMTGRQPVKLDWHCLHFFVAHCDGHVTLDRANVAMVLP
jgi:probable phosphoglycerate mutase